MKDLSRLKNNKGSTMVETLVSFVVLSIALVALYKIVSFSTTLWMDSVDSSRIQQAFYKEIYKKPEKISTTMINRVEYKPGSPSSEDDNMCANLYFELDTTRTDESNYNNSVIAADSVNIFLTHVGVNEFTCTDEVVDSNSLATPRVVVFEHKSN